MGDGGTSSIVHCPNCGKANRVRAVASGVPHCGACGEALPWLVDADQATFKAAVEESPLPVLVEFWATWCAPCRIVAPALVELSQEMAGRLKVVKVDSDASPQLSERFSVRGIPTLMLFDGGEVRARVTGAMGTPQLRQWLLTNLKSGQPA